MTLKEFAKKVTCVAKLGNVQMPFAKQDVWQRGANGYRVTLTYGGRSYSFDYWQGVGIKTDPTAEGCLESLQLDARCGDQAFADFCADTGADEDSRSEERIWKACRKTAREMRKLFGKDFETFMSA